MGKPEEPTSSTETDAAQTFNAPRVSHGPSTTSPSAPKHGSVPEAKITFLTLPLEIRIAIYEELLVNQYRPLWQSPWLEIGNTGQSVVTITRDAFQRKITMEPEILQTCKQIYHEARKVLYSQNIFEIHEPKYMVGFLQEITPANASLIRNLQLIVSEATSSLALSLHLWVELLNQVARNMRALRFLTVEWPAEPPFKMDSRRRTMTTPRRGLGDNLEFVRSLGKIRVSEELVLWGYYAKRWPAYLEERVEGRVRAMHGPEIDIPSFTKMHPGCLAPPPFIEGVRKKIEENFRNYQEGTEDLIPEGGTVPTFWVGRFPDIPAAE